MELLINSYSAIQKSLVTPHNMLEGKWKIGALTY